jgi:hypothetical protein
VLLLACLGSLASLHLATDLGDVTQPAPAGGVVEAQPYGNLGRRQQGELRGGVVLGHTPIMKKGCHNVTEANVQRAGVSG